jgi:hypothetical protein
LLVLGFVILKPNVAPVVVVNVMKRSIDLLNSASDSTAGVFKLSLEKRYLVDGVLV